MHYRNRSNEKRLDKLVRKYRNPILYGTVMSIDPSIGSSSSMPGLAIFRRGELIEHGILQIDPRQDAHLRLQQISTQLRAIQRPDILVIEDIPPRRYGRGGNAKAHASLLKAMGATLASVITPRVVYMPISTWHTYVNVNVGKNYTKSDENDAIMMGRCLIQLAAEVDPLAGKGKKI